MKGKLQNNHNIIQRMICKVIGHKWFKDVIDVSSYSVPNEAFCVRCGRLEWIFNGCEYIPMNKLKEHFEYQLTERRKSNE